jgi:small neutral amino acid transporter SnatA (MarC family)
VALRESAIAFGVLLLFMFTGQAFLSLMHLSERSLEVAGGVILLIIAMRMIFASGGELYASDGPPREPLIFPLAVPLLAGPSAMATVLLLASRKWIGHSMVSAIEKLMGLVLTAIAVEMILAGLKRYFFET